MILMLNALDASGEFELTGSPMIRFERWPRRAMSGVFCLFGPVIRSSTSGSMSMIQPPGLVDGPLPVFCSIIPCFWLQTVRFPRDRAPVVVEDRPQ